VEQFPGLFFPDPHRTQAVYFREDRLPKIGLRGLGQMQGEPFFLPSAQGAKGYDGDKDSKKRQNLFKILPLQKDLVRQTGQEVRLAEDEAAGNKTGGRGAEQKFSTAPGFPEQIFVKH
jgi:hypothetical protein